MPRRPPARRWRSASKQTHGARHADVERLGPAHHRDGERPVERGRAGPDRAPRTRCRGTAPWARTSRARRSPRPRGPRWPACGTRPRPARRRPRPGRRARRRARGRGSRPRPAPSWGCRGRPSRPRRPRPGRPRRRPRAGPCRRCRGRARRPAPRRANRAAGGRPLGARGGSSSMGSTARTGCGVTVSATRSRTPGARGRPGHRHRLRLAADLLGRPVVAAFGRHVDGLDGRAGIEGAAGSARPPRPRRRARSNAPNASAAARAAGGPAGA